VKIRDLLGEIRGSAEYGSFLILLRLSKASKGNLSQENMKKFTLLTVEIAKKIGKASRDFVNHALPHSMPKDNSEKSLTGVRKKAEELDKTIEFTINDVLPEFMPFLKTLEKELEILG